MAYSQQLGYGPAPNSPFRPHHNQYGASERPHTAGSGQTPQFPKVGRAQTPHGGFRPVNDNSEVHRRRDGTGNSEWSGDRFGREQSGKLPYSQAFVETGSDPNLSPQALNAAGPYHASPVRQFKEPQFDRYQHQEQFQMSSRHRGIQPSQVLHQNLPTEPAFDDEPTQMDTGNYNMRDNQSDPRNYRARQPVKLSAAPKSIVDYQRGEPVKPRQQQDYAELYRQELFHGNDGAASGGVGANFTQAHDGDSRPQIQSSWPHQGQGGKKPTQQRILTRPSSPQSLSWDNPFPTFGAKRKNAGKNDGMDLNNSMSRMKLDIDSPSDPTSTQRPQTAGSKSSQTSSRAGQRRMDESGAQQASSPMSQKPSDRQYELGVTRPPPGRFGHSTSVEPFPPHDRHSEDTKFQPSFDSKTSSDLDTRRSRTMPNNISRDFHDFGFQGEYGNNHIRQEPGPNAGHYGRESVGRLGTRPANDFSQGMADRPSSKPHEVGNSAGNQELPLRSTSSYPRHSTHNSLGEVYDSYYHESVYDQQAYPQNKTRQRAESFDEDMPNFDAVPAARLGHRRGTTIDEHLQPLASVPAHPQPLVEGPRDRPETSPQNVHIAGQFNRSKSQPNLKDQRSRDAQLNNGFVFDLPSDAPPLPLVSPQRDTFAHQKIGPAGYSGGNGYMTGPQGPASDVQRGVPITMHSNGRAILNESHHNAIQGGSNPERYCSPPLQNEIMPHDLQTAPAREPTPGNAILPTSPPANPPKSADALPLHPAPVRPGLMQDSLPFQSAKPPPVRQYNSNSSSLQRQDPIPLQAVPVPSGSDRQSIPVTHEELEKLRQAVKSKPSDQKTQLLLAKKLVEASMVLADDSGRADPKVKNKNREKYILDAHKIVKKLVSAHSTDATFYLADCYSRGLLGLEVDPKEAFILYQTAAKAGHAQSAYRVSVCYEMGHEDGGGTKRDASKAVHWYQRAATLGDTPAMYKLGVIQLKGLLGQQRNPREALKWLKRAADQANEENPHALHELGLLYEGTSPNSPVNKDLEYSKQLFTQAANLGYKFSQFRLGCAYEYGLRGCPIDPRQSIAWYSKAAMQEEHQSELALSGWYLTGSEGVLMQSDTEAYLWARKAAQAGLAKAEYAMGYFTEVGIGVPANVEDAKRWYWRSASQNFPKARDRLEALRKGGAKMEKSRVSRSAIRKQTEGDCTIM